MNENTANEGKFSPDNGEVDNGEVVEVTEVLEVSPEVNVEGEFVQETVAFTPPANPSQPNNTNPRTSDQPPFPQAPPYPQGQAYQQAPPNYGGYPNPGQPFAGGAQYEGVFVEEVPWSDKSKLAAGLFGILLGTFGVHNFYLGYTGKAVAQLLITVLSFGLLSFVSAIWGLVEGILILSAPVGTQWDLDAQGLPMRPISASGA